MLTKNKVAGVLFLRAETPMHPGSGAPSGAIDLTVQRESHTQWPTIHASGLKGVLRDAWRGVVGGGDGANNHADVTAVFGPSRTAADRDGHAGCLTVTDARILAFPVASARGVFAWVTCPAVIDRLNRDLGAFGLGNPVPECPQPADDTVVSLCGALSLEMDGDEKVFLHDFEYVKDSVREKQEKLQTLAGWIQQRAFAEVSPEVGLFALCKRLCVVPDDDFTHLVCHATEVVSRNALDEKTRTVTKGALFSQEFLPAETVFYTMLLASVPRRAGTFSGARDVINAVVKHFDGKNVQIGGDETTGKGVCSLRVLSEG